MKVLVIEMQRTIERKLGSGAVHTLKQGQRYTMSAEHAAPYLQPATRQVRDDKAAGGLRTVTLPPAAAVITETIVDTDETAQAARTAEKQAARVEANAKAYFAEATIAEAVAAGETPVATPVADVVEDGG